MRRAARAVTALVLATSVSCAGLVAVGSSLSRAAAAVLAPPGGCWSYVPDGAAAIDAPPAADISTGPAPWTTEDGVVLLGNAGDTVTTGSRSVTAVVSSGPVLAPADAAGTAYFLLSVDGVRAAAPLTADFTVEGGAPVRDVVATGSLPVGAAGSHTIRLDGVYFDLPAAGRRVACNGQPVGVPGAVNPATTPLPTTVTSGYAGVASAAVEVADVAGQDVDTAARAGDRVVLRASGLASSGWAEVSLCASATSCSAPLGKVWVRQDGTVAGGLSGSVTLPDGVVPGARTLRVDDGVSSPGVALTVLDNPAVAATEEGGADTTTVTLRGTGWDPGREVVITGHTGADATSPTTEDDPVRATADADGAFEAEFEVADPQTATVAVTQPHGVGTLAASYTFSGRIGGPGDDSDTGDDSGDDSGDDAGGAGEAGSAGAGTGAGTDPGAAVAPVTAPVDIPPPGAVPVKNVPGTPVAPAQAEEEEELSVSEARIDGHATMSELFGGAPHRDLVFVLENTGDAPVSDPIVRVTVGRSADVEPEPVDVEVGDLDPGERTVVTVPLALGIAAFGHYDVVGQVGDTEAGAFTLRWTTYPYGLFVLNALALALLAFGVWHRLGRRRPGAAGAAGAAGPGGAEDGAAVVDLAAAQAWWETGSIAGVRSRTAAAGAGESGDSGELGGEAIVDLAAAEKWWRRQGRAGSRAS